LHAIEILSPGSRHRLTTFKGISMGYAISKRPRCLVCGVDTVGHAGWFLVVENEWLDRLRILSWHSSLAMEKDIKSVCCRDHLRTLMAHWLSQANLRLPPAPSLAVPVCTEASLEDFELSGDAMGRPLGELAVHREPLSRVWSGSTAALECILEALVKVEEDKSEGMDYRVFNPRPEGLHELSLQ
jgi:hypothetical protein